MSNYNAHENSPSSAYGEWETFGQPTTDEEWAAYDEAVAAEIAAWDEAVYGDEGHIWSFEDDDATPPF